MFPTITLILAAATFAQASIIGRALTSFPTGGKADYQLGGPYTPSADTKIVVRDRTAAPAAEKYNICYINGFQTQPGETAWWKANNDDLLLRKANGDYFEDEGWPGEFFLDTTTKAKQQRLATILNGWIDGCDADGFQAVEIDNLDTFTRAEGLLTVANNLALSKLIADHAHLVGLAIAQKNTGSELEDQGKKVAGFNFAIAEECELWNECESYSKVYGNDVIEIEYTDYVEEEGLTKRSRRAKRAPTVTPLSREVFERACSARGTSFSLLLRDRNVVPSQNTAEYYYEMC